MNKEKDAYMITLNLILDAEKMLIYADKKEKSALSA